jgi:two-component system sensor histidine kinase DctS
MMPPRHRTPWQRWRSAWRRWSLWTLLVVLVVSMLVTMVWLAGRYEASQVQSRLERDAADAGSDIRSALSRNVQSLQALQAGDPGLLAWEVNAAELLRQRRELVRIEWRDVNLRLRAYAQTPYRPVSWDNASREGSHSDAALACTNARRLSAPAYSGSYFQPHGDGLGSEMMELCLPLTNAGRPAGFLVATYALQEMLVDLVGHNLTRSQEASFTEADGTRLAVLGAARRGTRMFTAQQLLDLPGTTLVLRMDRWHGAPNLFPNVLTALVTAMSIALVTVMVVLVRDNRRRLRAERDLARRAGLSQGHGRLAGHRPARARPAGAHHLRQPRVLRHGGLQPARAARAKHVPRTLLAAGALRGIPAAPGQALCRQACPRARASNRSSCARTARAFRC